MQLYNNLSTNEIQRNFTKYLVSNRDVQYTKFPYHDTKTFYNIYHNICLQSETTIDLLSK